MTDEILIHRLDMKKFPVVCCDREYPNPKELMDHLLGVHEAEQDD